MLGVLEYEPIISDLLQDDIIKRHSLKCYKVMQWANL